MDVNADVNDLNQRKSYLYFSVYDLFNSKIYNRIQIHILDTDFFFLFPFFFHLILGLYLFARALPTALTKAYAKKKSGIL